MPTTFASLTPSMKKRSGISLGMPSSSAGAEIGADEDDALVLLGEFVAPC